MRKFFILCGIAIITLTLSTPALLTFAQSEEELRDRITAKNKEIDDLEKEIAEYQQQIVTVGKQLGTLQGALASLELSRKKLTADITLTQKKIDSVTLTIESLKRDIGDKEVRIDTQKSGLAESLREVSDADQTSLLEAILIYDDLGDFWGTQVLRDEVHGAIQGKVIELSLLKDNLNTAKDETEKNKKQLEGLRNQLADQRKIVEANKRETDKLVQQTKSQESTYKKLLADKQAKRSAFEQELLSFESQLRLLTDPSSIPHPGSGLLAWPVDNPIVTQDFGDTAFARSGAYSGGGHNGIDLRASPGTPIKSALSGVVWATGDTDTVCPGASYGKWVLIKHGNGLSTLYAHLSLIKVGEGQNVSTRDLIGYSGSTGYATGPHLHFTVYATQGTQIVSRKSRICSGTYTLPVADLKAYLNPMAYL